MARPITLPKLEAQLLQRELKKKQPNIIRNPEEDKALCLAYQQGDVSAAIQLIYRYLDKLSYIYRFPTRCKNRGGVKCKIDITMLTTKEDKEDLFQEIIYHFLELLLEYDHTQGDLQGLIVGKLHLRVFKYFYEDLVDIKFNEKELDDNYDMEEEKKEIFLEEKEVPDETKKLYKALAELTPIQRKVADLYIIKGFPSPEVAKELGVHPGRVRHYKRDVVRKLRKLMEAM